MSRVSHQDVSDQCLGGMISNNSRKFKNVWRYSCDEHVEAAVITVGACNKPHEALCGNNRNN